MIVLRHAEYTCIVLHLAVNKFNVSNTCDVFNDAVLWNIGSDRF